MAILLFAVISTIADIVIGQKSQNMVNDLPQITDRAEMEEALDDIYVRAAAVQHGELSDLSWQVESGYAGSSFLTWVFCLLIIFVINYPVNNDDDTEEKPEKNRNGKKKRRKK